MLLIKIQITFILFLSVMAENTGAWRQYSQQPSTVVLLFINELKLLFRFQSEKKPSQTILDWVYYQERNGNIRKLWR